MKKVSQSQLNMGFFPEKLFFRIGEASKLVGVEVSVLRYWESEFDFLRPRKGKSGQRLYTAEDIGVLLQIKRLLYEERYTIDGARKQLAIMSPEIRKQAEMEVIPESKQGSAKVISMVQERLRRILELMS
jgi:DNA-binding transcriptional MerR regulator